MRSTKTWCTQTMQDEGVDKSSGEASFDETDDRVVQWDPWCYRDLHPQHWRPVALCRHERACQCHDVVHRPTRRQQTDVCYACASRLASVTCSSSEISIQSSNRGLLCFDSWPRFSSALIHLKKMFLLCHTAVSSSTFPRTSSCPFFKQKMNERSCQCLVRWSVSKLCRELEPSDGAMAVSKQSPAPRD